MLHERSLPARKLPPNSAVYSLAMARKILKHIPQYFSSPITLERFEYKASSGSYKATEYLLSLLQFTAIAVLGGDPFVDLGLGEMETKLREKYIDRCQYSLQRYDPIAMAIIWAWPIAEGRIIVFNSEELMTAVEALCLLLCSEEPANIIYRLSEKYIQEEYDDREFFELGEAIKCLGVSREVVEKNSSANHPEILRGYDNYNLT
jgi:hypothetical protein